MKKFLLTIAAIIMVAITFAQTPNAFKYQAIARDVAGNIIQNQNVSFRISIVENGVDVYTETFLTLTNNFGLVNLEIGNGNVEFGDFTTIDWTNNTFSLKIEFDVEGGSAFELMGTSNLLAVPFALHAKTAENGFSGNYNDLANAPDLSNFDANSTDDFSGDYVDLTNKPTLAGDVVGDLSTNTVEKIQGMTVSTNIPANGQVLKWNATSQTWEPNDDALGAAGTTDGVVTSVNVSGTSSKTITLMRSNSLGDLTAIFTDEVNDADADPTNELQDISLTGTSLSISNGSTIDLSAIDTDTQLSEAEVDSYVSDNGYLTSFTEVDASTTNELQDISLTGTSLSISDGSTIDLSTIDTDTQLSEAEVDSYVSNNGYLTSFTEVDASTTNEIQTLSLSGSDLSISDGNTIDLSSLGGNDTDDQTLNWYSATGYLEITDGNYVQLTGLDYSTSNEIQDIYLSGNTVSLSGTSSTINLSSYLDNTDAQTLSLSGDMLTISGGNSINLASIGETDTDNQTLSLSGVTLSIADGNSVDLSTIDTKLSEAEVDAYVGNNGYLTTFAEVDGSTTNEIQTLSLSGNTLSINGGNSITLPSEVDASTTNEIQDLSLSGNTLSLSSDASTVSLAGYLDNTDSQTLSISGSTLSLTNGGSVTLPAAVEVDGSTTNEIQDAYLSAYYLGLTGSSEFVNLGIFMDNTDAQTLSLSGSNLSISGGNTLDLSSLSGDSDTDDQTLSLSGTTLTIADGNSVDLSSIDTDTQLSEAEVDSYVSDNGYLTSFTEVDGSTTNEIQDLSLSGNTLSLSSDASNVSLAAYLDNTDSQSLSLSGSDLSISGGNTVSLSSLVGADDQTLSEVLTSGTDAGNKNIVNVAQAGIGTATPNASAALEISSTTKGFLPPRMTETQMLALTAVEGLTVYNTTNRVLVFYNGSEWRNYDNTPYLYVGKSYQGGVIAYIYTNGDAGYVADEIHGIIATPSDQSSSAIWGCNTIFVGTNSGLGQGQTSTDNIIAACATVGIAARICNDLVLDTYGDWFLPSKDELYKLYSNRTSIGGFTTGNYWTSTQYSTSNAYYYNFSNGVSYNTNKENFNIVRAVRYF